MMNRIKNIELPKDDSRCASILRTVIRNLNEKEKVNESRTASSSSQGYANVVYALRQKMFGSYLPSTNTTIINHQVINEGFCFTAILEAGPPGLIANSTKSFHLGVTNCSYV